MLCLIVKVPHFYILIMPFPSKALMDQDDSGILSAVIVTCGVIVGIFHKLSIGKKSRNIYLNSSETMKENEDLLRVDSNLIVGSDKKQRSYSSQNSSSDINDTWTDSDIRDGSHTWISRRKLLFFRILFLAACIPFWVEFWRTGCKWEVFLTFQPWHFVLLSLLFFWGVVVSFSSGNVKSLENNNLRIWEQMFLVLLEIETPTTIFLFILYWPDFMLASEPTMMFPSSNNAWVNTLFVSVSMVLVLLEMSLNRIILHSHRWMYFSYLYLLYILFLLCTEKLFLDSKLLYQNLRFLELRIDSIPLLIELWILYFCCHYVGCGFVSIKQFLWMTPVYSKTETIPNANNHDVFIDSTEGTSAIQFNDDNSITQPLL